VREEREPRKAPEPIPSHKVKKPKAGSSQEKLTNGQSIGSKPKTDDISKLVAKKQKEIRDKSVTKKSDKSKSAS
jgi:hypothetical protein